MRTTPFLLPILALLIAMVSIQSGAALAKQLFPVIGPEGTAALRLLFAALILCLLWRPWRGKLTRREILPILVYGLSIGGMNLLVYLALVRIPLGIAVALEFTGPLAVTLLASRRVSDFVWIGLAVTGVALLLPLTGASAALDPAGVALALGAGLCWALYIWFGQKAGNTVHGGTVTALGMAAGALMVTPFGLAHAGAAIFTWDVLPFALGIAVLSSAFPYSLEMLALQKLPAKTFGILMSLEPAIGALSGFIFLSERLETIQWLAIFCIILASIGSTRSARRTAMAPEVTA